MPRRKPVLTPDGEPVDWSRGQTLDKVLARCVEEGDCLIWQGYMAKYHTPMLSHKRRQYAVRRVVAFLTNHSRAAYVKGYWSTSCGTPGCCAPVHLTFRNPRQHAKHTFKKISETAIKLRNLKVSKIVPRKIPLEDVEVIRNSTEPTSVLAARYGCSTSLINRYKSKRHASQILNPWSGLL